MKRKFSKAILFLPLIGILFLSGCSLPASISKFSPFGKKSAPAPQTEEKNIESSNPAEENQNNSLSVVSPEEVKAPLPLAKEDAHKGVVKIKTLILDNTGGLIEYSGGSGVVVSPEGFILTNSHVVTVEDVLDKSDKNAVFGVCFTADMNKEPDCSQTAELVLKDKDLDIALLRLNSAGSLPFLELNATGTASTSEEVFALGYPGIGQDTITLTKGIISGQLEKYGKKWIKTDAVVSFGSSGGAAIDKNGKVLGITTAGYSDTLGELGYIIDSTSIADWVKKSEAAYQPAAINFLNERTLKFLKKQTALKTSAVFTNDYPNITITRPDGWDFQYEGENSVAIFSKKEEEKSGSISFEFSRQPHLLTEADIMPIFKKEIESAIAMIKINKEQAANIGGFAGKKITISAGGRIDNLYAFIWRDYVIEVSYSYGENDKDKEIVDGILNSIKAGENKDPFSEDFSYISASPVFGLSSIKDWPLMEQTEKSQPLSIKSKKIKEAFINISLSKNNDTNKNLTNKELAATLEEANAQGNQAGEMMDIKNKIISLKPDYKLNEEFKEVIKMESDLEKISSKEVFYQSLDYIINLNSEYRLNAALVVVNKDKKAYEAAVADFNKIISSLTANPKIDSDQDGLSDEEESKLGTNLKNSDTDGDGYLDGSEVVNGYNPNGK